MAEVNSELGDGEKIKEKDNAIYHGPRKYLTLKITTTSPACIP